MRKTTVSPEARTTVAIKPPNFKFASFNIIGTSPLVICKFSQKAKAQIIATQESGARSTKGKAKEPKNFDELLNQARHISVDGWDGIPANAFRAGMVSMCRLAGFKMTLSKLALFVEADGYDADEGTPLIKIIGNNGFEKCDIPTRNADFSVDIHPRPMWREWAAKIRVRFDADIFSLEDVANLLTRLGMQGGVGEGRADSKRSCGMGWGFFRLEKEA